MLKKVPAKIIAGTKTCCGLQKVICCAMAL
jgi:hypothetical protein